MSLLKNKKVLMYLVCYTVLVFLSGIFIGKCAAYNKKSCYRKSSFSKMHHVEKNGEDMHDHMLRKFTKKLDLNEAQQVQVKEILSKYKPSLKEMRSELHKRFEETRKAFESEMIEILSEEQKEKFQKFQKRFKKHHSH